MAGFIGIGDAPNIFLGEPILLAMQRLLILILMAPSLTIFGQSSNDAISVVLFDGDSISDALSYSEIDVVGNVTQTPDSVCAQGTVGLFPGNSHLQFPGDFTFTTEFAFSMFVKPDGTYDGFDSGEGAILINKEEEYELALRRNNGIGQLQYALRTNGNWTWTYTTVSLPFDEWSHVVWQFDNGVCEIALNGQLVYSLGQSGSTLQNGTYTASPSILRVGARAPEQNQSDFAGSFEDIYIFDRALDLNELVEISSCFAPVFGCLNSEACNFDSSATIDNDTCLFLDECGECGGNGISGCVDTYACNFDENASCDNGTCDYSCCPGPGCCDQGLTWNWELSLCQNLNPADINLDGCIQLNDLLDLLSAYGNCAADESVWQCGDPLDYQGYSYGTVQIGEQCWFNENLRSESFMNGDMIPSDLSDSDWQNSTSAAMAVYGEDAGCNDDSPDISACDPAQSYIEYGLLYNWYAVDDVRGLCPTGWHVPSDGEWMTLEIDLGMIESEASNTDIRGTDQGVQMKTTYGWNFGNGTNSSGFSGLPSGYRNGIGFFHGAGNDGLWWSSTVDTDGQVWDRIIQSSIDGVRRTTNTPTHGFSVRCIKE